MRKGIGIAVVLAVTGALPLAAQGIAPPRGYLGGGIDVAHAVGEFADYVKSGVGLGGVFLWRPDRTGSLGLRFSGNFLIYGSQTRRYPLVPGISVDVTTNNTIGSMSVGPQLMLGDGALLPWVHGGIGFSYFATTSSVEGSDNTSSFARSTNFDDITFAPEFGGGLLVRLSAGRNPVLLDLSARFINNGRVTYVTRDRISVVNNELVLDPVTSEANLMIYRVGVMVGLRRSAGGSGK
jgi:hypothetical protein